MIQYYNNRIFQTREVIETETLNIRADGSEVLKYNAPDFPISTAYADLAIFPGFAAGCHWHKDYEALIALDGDMDYRVNGQHVYLKKGDAIFVNSNRLHYGYSAEKKNRNYCFAVFHPELLGLTPAVASAQERLARDSGQDYWLLSNDDEKDRQAIEDIRFLCDHADPKEAVAVIAACASLISRIIARDSKNPDQAADPDWAIIRKMIGYIQNHYQERILLEEIAAAGTVCRSRCCRLFREKLQTTPMNYVIRYRLDKACDLIREGSNITDAAFSVGFQGLSYFSESFKKTYGMKPSQYQIKH